MGQGGSLLRKYIAQWERFFSRCCPGFLTHTGSGIVTPMSDRISVITGDITTLDVDAIVNAANSSLLGGGGVDGAIHRAAGPELLAECRTLGGCPTGEARLTAGYQLPARHVIHTVGPVWHGNDALEIGKNAEDDLLAMAYASSLGVASQHALGHIAFPSISTGAFGFPKLRAARIATGVVRGFLAGSETPAKVTFCAFSDEDAEVIRKALELP